MQIRDMIQAVIPVDYQQQIRTCCLVGGMSIQKQQRLLSYKPTIVIATPGRLWELMDDQAEPYLVNTLPMIDTLVLDEADRMIADGHFKELKFILKHIYTKRVEFKRESIKKNKLLKSQGIKQETEDKTGMEEMRDQILNQTVDVMQEENKNFRVGQNLVMHDKSFDMSKVVDLN